MLLFLNTDPAAAVVYLGYLAIIIVVGLALRIKE